MPRYDLNCPKCKKETIYYFQRDVQVEWSEIPCGHCDYEHPELIAFYEDEQSQIMALQKEIDTLIDSMNDLLERLGYSDLKDNAKDNKLLN
jgi:hypothetical protein